MKDNRFEINFNEFCFLVEACIPPVFENRLSFWKEVIDKYFSMLTPDEANNLRRWIVRNHKFDFENEYCLLFMARYDVENNYRVTTKHDIVYNCFLYNDKYYYSHNAYISVQDIVRVEKMTIMLTHKQICPVPTPLPEKKFKLPQWYIDCLEKNLDPNHSAIVPPMVTPICHKNIAQ